MYGCSYHAKRGPMVCKNNVVIRQEKLDAAFLDALGEAIDDRLLASAVAKAVRMLTARRGRLGDDRAALVRERDRAATAIRHLVDAVKRGHATDTLLAELATQEAAVKTLERRVAELDGSRVVPIDDARLTARVEATARAFRARLRDGGSGARRLLQRVLNGRRVPCEAFREAGRRGYRFREEVSYTALFTELGGLNGIRPTLTHWRFDVKGAARVSV